MSNPESKNSAANSKPNSYDNLGTLTVFNISTYPTFEDAKISGALYETDVSDMHGSIVSRTGTICSCYEAMKTAIDCIDGNARIGYVLCDENGVELERSEQ